MKSSLNLPVNFKKFMFTLGSLLFLAGCTEAVTKVSSLGRKVEAPTLNSSSPFSQNFDGGSSLLEFHGSCHQSIEGFEFLVKDDNWTRVGPKATMPDSLTPVPINDLDCSDGNFRFYISENDLVAAGLIINEEESQDNIKDFRIRGIAKVFGISQEFVFTNNGESKDREPTHIQISKTHQESDIFSGVCHQFYAYLGNSRGHSVSAKSDLLFLLSSQLFEQPTEQLAIYNSNEDCINNTPSSELRFPKGTDQKGFFAKINSSNSGSTTVLLFAKNKSPLQLQTQLPASGALFNFHSTTNDLIFLNPSTYLGTVYNPNTCFNMAISQGNATLTEFQQTTVNIQTADAADLIFYRDSNCSTTPTTSLSLYGTAEVRLYFKYTGTVVPKTIKVNFSGTSATHTVISTSTYLRFALPTNLASSFLALNPVNNFVNNYECSSFEIAAYNSLNQIIPLTETVDLNFTAGSAMGQVYFYSDPSCTSPILSVQASSTVLSRVYFKPKFITGASITLQAATDSLPMVQVLLPVQKIASQMSFYQVSIPATSCSPVELMFKSSLDLIANIHETRVIDITSNIVTSAGVGVGDIFLHTDPTCSTAGQILHTSGDGNSSRVTTLTATPGISSFRFYIKANNLLSLSSSGNKGQLNFSARAIAYDGALTAEIFAPTAFYYIK